VVDEFELIQRCQRGETQAFGILVQQHMKSAYFIALGLVGSHETALDLSQEAFVRAFRSIQKFDPQRKFFTWFYQILRNLCFNSIRNKARQAAPFSEIGTNQINQIIDSSQNADENLERDELKEILWQALNSLKPHEKEIIVLKDFQDLSYKEIATILQCPVGTVMSRLFAARKTLKTKLEEYYHV